MLLIETCFYSRLYGKWPDLFILFIYFDLVYISKPTSLSFLHFEKCIKFLSTSSSLGKNYPNFFIPKLILHNISHDILHLASLSKRLQWYEEEEKRTTYIFYAWMSATTLLFLSLVLWRICLSNMRKQTNKQKLFVKCLWMNWLIATNIYNVNKNAWGNIYIAEKNH